MLHQHMRELDFRQQRQDISHLNPKKKDDPRYRSLLDQCMNIRSSSTSPSQIQELSFSHNPHCKQQFEQPSKLTHQAIMLC